ncbi:DUF881 domain-containing protein [Promicromonospora sp. MEB111]|uniref:DUF881 domain-containing protein n=1 Tax=unclassified Promicromonospora TaxID=2647929 RepID=UPI00254D0E78|nr:DUF881 domain-containing protein [Promicromonospora sp. MEB111]
MGRDKNGAGAKPDKSGSNKPGSKVSGSAAAGPKPVADGPVADGPVADEPLDDAPVSDVPADDEPAAVPDSTSDSAPEPASGWKRVGQLLRPRGTRSELLTGLLCLALGFALAVQVGQSTGDQLSSLRQDELVRLLDEVTQRAEQLDAEVSDLEEIRDDLQSEDGRDQAARDLAQQRAEQEGILSGRLPAQGPGVQIHVADGAKPLEAQALFNLLEELRNAGAEAIQVNGVRLVTTSYFVDSGGGIVLDGAAIASPYEWTAIGDPDTIDRALEIPGGALPRIREEGGEATTTTSDEVLVDAVRIPGQPEHAEPVAPGDEK